MADIIRAGVEAKTAVEDLSAKSFPCLRVRVVVMGRVRVTIRLGVGFRVSRSYDICCRWITAVFCHLCTSVSDGQYH